MTNQFACHYFRLAPHRRELMLTRIHQMGADTVYTPVPWRLHEFEAGKFDLHGVTDPRRNLVGFMQTAQAMGFTLILDLTPGPIAGDRANLLQHGLPSWLLINHPETRATNAQGEAQSICTFTHPTFTKFLARWFEQLAQVLPFDSNVKLQLAPHLPSDYLDYNDHILKVQWPIWLRKRYAEGGIEAINQAYQPASPYRSVSHVPLTADLATPAFQQDKADFQAAVKAQTQVDLYDLLHQSGLTTQAQVLDSPIEPPPHAFQVPSDAIDVGSSFHYAPEAPLQADGSCRYGFWQQQQAALQAITPDQLGPENQLWPADGKRLKRPKAPAKLYRLLLTGAIVAGKAGQAVAVDELGETDCYFALPNAETPLSGFLENRLRTLLVGQQQTAARGLAVLEQLQQALQPSSTSPQTAATPYPLSEAQSSLEEASLALRRAAASIGALEEAFSTALDKPQAAAAPPLLLSLDGSKLGFVREACQTASEHLRSVTGGDLLTSATVSQYQANYERLIAVAHEVITLLGTQVQSLREGLALGGFSHSARTVHHYLEIVLQSLSAGVLRQ